MQFISSESVAGPGFTLGGGGFVKGGGGRTDN